MRMKKYVVYNTIIEPDSCSMEPERVIDQIRKRTFKLGCVIYKDTKIIRIYPKFGRGTGLITIDVPNFLV